MRQTPQKTFWRILGVLLAFVMVLALVPRTTYAANYSTKNLRMAKNEKSYTVKVNYPVVGYVDATVKLTMTENKPYQDFVDGKMYRNVGLKVEYELKKSALNKIKKNAAKILKSTDGKMIYDFEVFFS